MTIKHTNRNLGYAISKLFKESFATYRDNIYKVEEIIPGGNILLEWDVYEKMRERLKLIEPGSTFMLPVFKKPNDPSEETEYREEFMEKMRLREISKVNCLLSDELKVFLCPECHKLFIGTKFIKERDFTFFCDNCDSILDQAPILVRNKITQENREQQQLIKRIKAKKGVCNNIKCKNYNRDEWLGLNSTDREKPMGSLMWVCTNCSNIVLPFEAFKMGGYKPQLPSENLTKGIIVSVSKDYNSKEFRNIPLFNRDMIKNISFSNNIHVWQVTWGYKLGQYENIQYKTFTNNEYYGRKMKTQGISITLNPKIYETSKNYLKKIYIADPEYYKQFETDLSSNPELQIRRWVLHSLKHSMLMFLPLFTGLPHREFGGSYDIGEGRVTIFDNQDGGIGGCKKLFDNQDNLIDLFDTLINRVFECDCRSKCPECLGLETCGEVNQALNRHLLAPLFNGAETFYD